MAERVKTFGVKFDASKSDEELVDELVAGFEAMGATVEDDVSKHDGPGPHDSGSPQDAHSGEFSIPMSKLIPEGESHPGAWDNEMWQKYGGGEYMGGLTESVRESGVREPIDVYPAPWGDFFYVVDGHHRVLAARRSGIKDLKARLFRED